MNPPLPPEIAAAVALLRADGWTVSPPRDAQSEPQRQGSGQKTSSKPGSKTLEPGVLGALLVACEGCDRLTDFQQSFVDSLRERFEKYQDNVFLSPKQMEVIETLQEKVFADA